MKKFVASQWAALLLAVLLAIAAITSHSSAWSKLLPVMLGGLVLLLGFEFYKQAKAQQKISATVERNLLFGTGILLTLLVRIALFPFESGDYTGNLSGWYDTLKSGGFRALKDPFHDYPPAYLYLLYFATLVPMGKLLAIKLISVCFDYLAAWFIYRIIRMRYNRTTAAAGCFLFLLSPTVLLNSSMWGQCDIIFTCGLLATVYYALRMQYTAAMVAFALAFCFKFQSVFLVLLPVAFYLTGKIQLRHLLLVPLVFLVSVLPNWAAGRSLADLLFIYAGQAQSYPVLTLFAPSVYHLMLWAPVELFDRTGLLFTGSLVGFFALWIYRKQPAFTPDLILKTALLSALLLPFFLPRMHERYFFAADVLSIVYAFYYPRRFYVALLVVLSSFFSYLHFLMSALEVFPFKFLSLAMLGALVVVATDYVRSFVFVKAETLKEADSIH